MFKASSPLSAFLHWEKTAPNRIFLKQPINGKVITYTFKQAGEEARKIANEIQSYGLPSRSHIAILSKNCAHWIMADLAIMMADCVSIPIYPTLTQASIRHVLSHSESKAIIIGKLDDYSSQAEGVTDIHKIFVGTYDTYHGRLWEDIVTDTKPLINVYIPKPEDLHTIIYTSGTTGLPKGVMHAVSSFNECFQIFNEMMKLENHRRLFSYLPLGHIAERLAVENCGLYLGAEISFAESLETFASDLEACQPHLFLAVPRIWTKFQDKILEKLPQKKLNYLLNIPIINGIIKSKLKKKLGLKHAEVIFSGAAPLSSSLMRWYKKIDIEILQAYGMTEDCVVSHFNTKGFNKIGTVGRTVPTAKTKFSEDGELLIKNNCLMKGYFKAPERTVEVFTDDGYLRTGDKAEYDHEGYLTITGRAKDEFKTDKGKYVAPSPIELLLSANTDIEQICLVGTGIPQPIALITLSELGKGKTKEALSLSLIESISKLNPSLEKHEKIEKIVIMKEDWTVDNGLTTPTLKVKRNAIERIHQPLYSKWFAMENKVIFE